MGLHRQLRHHGQVQPRALQERKVRSELKKAEELRRGQGGLEGLAEKVLTVQHGKLGLILGHTVEGENGKGRVD